MSELVAGTDLRHMGLVKFATYATRNAQADALPITAGLSAQQPAHSPNGCGL